MDFTVRRNLSKPGGSKSQTQDFPRKSYGTGASPNPAPTEKIQMDRSASGISGFNRERWIYPKLWRFQTSCKAFKGFKTRQKEEKETQTETVSTSRLSRAENTDRCKICAILLCDRWKKVLPVYGSR